jgi:hypothetical protein
MLDGEAFYFNTKFEPKCGVGDVVGIEFDKKADNRGQIQKIVVLEDSGSPKGVQESAGFGGGSQSSASGGSNYTPNTDRQDSIVYQSSRKDALVLAEILVSNEAIKLPKDADKRRMVIEELVNETTFTYFKAASDPQAALKGEEAVAADAADEPQDNVVSLDTAVGDDSWDDDSWE